MKDYELYIFDFDGTLVDSETSLFPVFQAAFADIGRETTPADVSKYIHISLQETMDMTHVPEDQRPIFMASITRHLDDPESIAMIRFFPDAREVVEELLRRGKKVAIGSNNVVKHMELVLEGLGGKELFMDIVGSDSVVHPKPAPDIVLKASADLGLPCGKRVAYIGDSLQDAVTGLAAGGDGILVDRNNAYPEFEGIKISSLKELLV